MVEEKVKKVCPHGADTELRPLKSMYLVDEEE